MPFYSPGTMSDFRKYSREFVKNFINMYKDNKCLWHVTSKNYSNKNIRNVAYEKLVVLFKTVEPEADKALVLKKINSMRTTYRKEYKKVKESITSCSDDLYTPNLWYYEHLKFLGNQIGTIKSRSNMDQEVEISTDTEVENSKSTIHSDGAKTTMITPSADVGQSNTKRKKKKDSNDVSLRKIAKTLKNKKSKSVNQLFATYITGQLDEIQGTKMVIIAKKLMSDVLFEAQMGTLTPNTKISHIHVNNMYNNSLRPSSADSYSSIADTSLDDMC